MKRRIVTLLLAALLLCTAAGCGEKTRRMDGEYLRLPAAVLPGGAG